MYRRSPLANRFAALVAATAAVAVLLGIGAYAIARRIGDRIANSVPTADLFGSSSAPARPSPTPPPGADIKGPLNFLIIGEDTRSAGTDPPHNDANMILHVSADLATAYLVSLPRDLLVDIPAYEPSGTRATHEKLAHALSYGSRLGQGKYDTKQGFGLVFETISEYTGIQPDQFHAGVLFSFAGMTRFVDAIGGVDIYVDERVESIHKQPDGKHRTPCGGCAHGYTGPRMVYEVGPMHMVGWQALDYARQRYSVKGSTYGRERHHRQLVVAVMRQLLSANFWLNPVKIDRVLDAVGKGVIFDGRGRSLMEYAYALRNLRPEAVTLIGLPGSGVSSGGSYRGERLNSSVAESFFTALRQDKLAEWVAQNPEYVNDANLS